MSCAAGGVRLQSHVPAAEDLMESEHADWIDQMPQLGALVDAAPDGPQSKTN
jgi:hypothetical protein